MRWKAVLLIGVAVGYVLGARAGRQSYERIRATSQKVWHSPPAEEARAGVAAKLDEAGVHAAHLMREKVSTGGVDGTEGTDGRVP